MKFPLSWLREHLDTDAGLGKIVERLTMLGLEVDQVIDRGEALREFVAGRVVEARKHPDADRLRVCRVDTGSAEIEVVCGAPNARAGMVGVFAGNGAYIPGIDLKLKKTKIRGVLSNGMLLSERELGLSDEHEGIVELPEDTEPGAPAAAAMGLDDPVIDIEITPNRGDCLGVRGIARDLAAAGLGTLKPLEMSEVAGTFDSPIKVHLDFAPDRADACPYFVGRYLRGVDNGESPDWLKEKLLAVGLRPISALVDITNYMTIGLCRPLHVFDADKVKGSLHVRLARSDEMLEALDGKVYDLDGEMTVIADDETAEALGGVMGGIRTGCTRETVNVFIESALFDPVRTAATGRKLNLSSDARFRFERGIDPSFLAGGIEIATRLVLDICGGEPSGLVIAGGEPGWKRSYLLRNDRVLKLGGLDVPGAEIERILDGLGFILKKTDGGLEAAVPPWRNDIAGEADLVEEVLRVHGFERIPSVPMAPASALPQPTLTPEQRRHVLARRVLAQRGLVEAVTLSFMPSDQARLFGGAAQSVRLVNPISSELDVMRPSILPNLIAAAGRNADRGVEDAVLFEVGPQYAGDGPGDQALVAAGVRAGNSGPRSWAAPPRPVDAFDVKADALATLQTLGVNAGKLQVSPEAPQWYHPGRSGSMKLGPHNVLARFGEVHPRVLEAMDVKGPIAGFEVYLDNLPKAKARKSAAKPHLDLPPFHTVERDFAFVVDDAVPAEDVLKAARAADKELIVAASVFDVFSGGALKAGKKSLAVNITLQPTEKTLTDPEIEAVAAKVVAGVVKATGGKLRS